MKGTVSLYPCLFSIDKIACPNNLWKKRFILTYNSKGLDSNRRRKRGHLAGKISQQEQEATLSN